MFVTSLFLAALAGPPAITLAEARSMTPTELADRLLPNRAPRPVVDAIINGRGLVPPSQGVNRVWIVEQMVPFDETTCRSHLYELEMEPADPAANAYRPAVATRLKRIEERDRLWVPPGAAITRESCAAAPATEAGFSVGSLGLQEASERVRQARDTFRSRRRFSVELTGARDLRGTDPRAVLAGLRWSGLARVEAPSPTVAVGAKLPRADRDQVDMSIQFTFPYAGPGGTTWFVTVNRGPKITSVKMDARSVVYH